MAQNTFNKNSSGSILIVMLFAIAGYLLTFLYLTNNFRHPEINQVVQVINYKSEFKVKEVSPDTVPLIRTDMVKAVEVDKNNLLFNKNPLLIVWMTLILMMLTIASASLPVFIVQVFKIRTDFKLSVMHVVRAILMAVIILLFLFITQKSLKGIFDPSEIVEKFGVLFKSKNVMDVVVSSTLLLQIPTLIVIFLAGISSGTVSYDLQNKESVERTVFQYSDLNQKLLNALQILAILVVFSVLTTSALQQSLKNTVVISSFDIAPKEIGFAYGLYFSLFLGIIYIPNYIYLKMRYNKLRNELQRKIESTSDAEKDWSVKIFSLTSFGNTALDNIKLSITVLAPLISGFLPEQLRLFG